MPASSPTISASARAASPWSRGSNVAAISLAFARVSVPSASSLPMPGSRAPRVQGSNATGRGNPYLGAAVGEAVVNAGRTDTFLGAKYHRMCKLGGKWVAV